MSFHDREHAARLLAGRLRACKGRNPLILAIPRGAVPMGKVLADALDGELDVVLVRKLGAPGHAEYALGAVCENGHIILRQAPDVAAVPRAYIEAEAQRQMEVLRQRRASYTPDRPPADPAGRVVIVVDDGIATGATLKAALSVTRARHPRELIAAVGVAAESSLDEVRALADEVVCLETPPWFVAVSEFFDDFRQVEDSEVIEILRAAHAPRKAREAEIAAAAP